MITFNSFSFPLDFFFFTKNISFLKVFVQLIYLLKNQFKLKILLFLYFYIQNILLPLSHFSPGIKNIMMNIDTTYCSF